MRILLAVLAALLPATALAGLAKCTGGVCTTTIAPPKGASSGKTLVVFGDSFSDIANAYEASKMTFPTAKNGYVMGRFTNGPGWTEYAVNNTGATLINYAYPGSTANEPADVFGQANAGLPFTVPTLSDQVQDAIKTHKKTLAAKSTAFIWSGSNDISNLLQANFGFIPNLTISNQTLFDKAATIAPTVAKAIEDLLDYGFTKRVVVSNIQPIEKQPIWYYAIVQSGFVPKEYQQYSFMTIASLVKFVNDGMVAQLERLQKKYAGKAVIEGYDANEFYTAVMEDAAAYGFKEFTWSCITAKGAMGLLSATEDASTPLNATCSNPDEYMFWDASHPTTAFYQVLAKDLGSALDLLTPGYMGDFMGFGATACDASDVMYACMNLPNSTGKYFHPCDRSKYLNCNKGVGTVMSCKAGQVYNVKMESCEVLPKQAPETIGRAYYDTSVFTIAHFIVKESDRKACKDLCMGLGSQVKTLPYTLHSRCTFGEGNGTHYEMVVTERTADAPTLIYQFTVTLPLQFQFLSLANLQSLWVLGDAPDLLALKPYFLSFPFAPLISFYEIGLGAHTRF